MYTLVSSGNGQQFNTRTPARFYYTAAGRAAPGIIRQLILQDDRLLAAGYHRASQ